MTIVDNLRIMGDALVLLNPIKKPTAAGLISHEIWSLWESTIKIICEKL